MGKFIVVCCFALLVCGVVLHFAPAVGHVLFSIGSVGVTGTMLLGVGAIFGGYKLSGK